MMNIRSLALACAVVTIPAAIAAPSPAFQQAILAELDQATRAEVQPGRFCKNLATACCLHRPVRWM
jgi:hypothetical protein